MLLGGLFSLFNFAFLKVGDGTVIKAIDEASDIPVISSRPGDLGLHISILENCQGVRGMREGGIRQLYVPVRNLVHQIILAIITSHRGSWRLQQTLGRTEL